ncbi:MAG: hypothetical protein ACRED4_08615 [Brevundimonas sp.]
MRGLHKATAVFCAIGFAAIAGTASAGDPGAPADGVDRLEIEVAGHIPSRCAMGSIADRNLGGIDGGGMSLRTELALDCNVPFALTFASANGGLAHTSLPLGQGPYAGRLGYEMQVDLPIRLPTRQTVSSAFTSNQMRAGAVVSSLNGISDGPARIRMFFEAASGAGLLAGHYSETVTITLAPKT